MRPFVVVLLVVLVVGPPAGAQTLQDIQERLAEVQQEREGIEERIAEATVSFDELETRIAELEQEQGELDDELTTLRGELDELTALVTFRVRETFKHGQSLDPIAVFLGTEDPGAALSKAQTVQRVVSADRARSEDLTAVRTEVAAAEERLAARLAELDEARDEQREVTARLQDDFAEIQRLEEQLTQEERDERERLERERREREERERREREEREERERRLRLQRQQERDQQAAPAPAPAPAAPASEPEQPTSSPSPGGGGMVCPLDNPRHYIDSWGHSRSGGRGHRGTDIMGPRGIPVRAITSGTYHIQSSGPSAGLWAILRGDNGDHYWYMHLDSHTVSNGARVSAGQQVGTNGSTGNASAGAEHLHFELHPGGGSAVNPYSLVRSVCG